MKLPVSMREGKREGNPCFVFPVIDNKEKAMEVTGRMPRDEPAAASSEM